MLPSITGARYVHTNLVARDWRRLADFYCTLLGCRITGPERDYSGAALEAGTGLGGVRLRGAHLLLPGFADGGGGPTLEIFEYAPPAASGDAGAPRPVHHPGFGHIAFAVDSVPEARAAVLAQGGSAVGEVVTLSLTDGARVTWCYGRDPEGNAIELQSWQGPE